MMARQFSSSIAEIIYSRSGAQDSSGERASESQAGTFFFTVVFFFFFFGDCTFPVSEQPSGVHSRTNAEMAQAQAHTANELRSKHCWHRHCLLSSDCLLPSLVEDSRRPLCPSRAGTYTNTPHINILSVDQLTC